jgi:tRNA-specific 2-thiouridylase
MIDAMSVPPAKVLVAMSGGVDSSVAAALLQQAGHEVVGCFMRLGSPGESLEGMADPEACGTSLKIGHQGCCSINDAADARQVAARLGVPFYVCNFKRDFSRVIDYFVGEYNAGRTPNPCVRCNDWLKFGKLHEYARSVDAEYVASGHYARIDRSDPGRPRLLRGVDSSKDQSYVLFGSPLEQLGEMLLPIGGMPKSQVRELAREFNLPVFDKPDSQEICFVPDNDYAGLVKRRTPDAVEPGAIVDRDGTTIGEHGGHQHFTVGQRRGVGIAFGHPIYVIEKNAETNTIVVGERDDLKAIGCDATETNWLEEPCESWRDCAVKIRYNAPPVPGRVRATGEASLEVRFDDDQDAVAPGQAVVCYDDEAVICGGWIRTALRGSG